MSRRRFRLPAPPTPAAAPDAFVLLSVASLPAVPADQAQWQRALYQWAFEEAQAVARPSLPERDLLGVWN